MKRTVKPRLARTGARGGRNYRPKPRDGNSRPELSRTGKPKLRFRPSAPKPKTPKPEITNPHLIMPSVWIGKRGLSESQISEIKAQLERKSVIKVKALRSALMGISIRELADQLSTSSGSELVSVTGLVIVLRRADVRRA